MYEDAKNAFEDLKADALQAGEKYAQNLQELKTKAEKELDSFKQYAAKVKGNLDKARTDHMIKSAEKYGGGKFIKKDEFSAKKTELSFKK